MFKIKLHSKQNLNGITCSGFKSKGEAIDFFINDKAFKAKIRYNNWENGERDITCIDIKGDSKLSTAMGRMRLKIFELDEFRDRASLRTAIFKNLEPPHATLCKRGLEFYTEELNLDLVNELKKFGDFQLDTKEILLNSIGNDKKELCITFSKENFLLPVAVFVLTRIYALTSQIL